MDVREHGAVGSGGERPGVRRPAPGRVPAVPALRVVERSEELGEPGASHHEPGVRRADQRPAVDREEAPSRLPLDRRDRLDLFAADPDHVAAVRQHPPTVAARRQRRDLAVAQPGLPALPDDSVPRADQPAHPSRLSADGDAADPPGRRGHDGRPRRDRARRPRRPPDPDGRAHPSPSGPAIEDHLRPSQLREPPCRVPGEARPRADVLPQAHDVAERTRRRGGPSAAVPVPELRRRDRDRDRRALQAHRSRGGGRLHRRLHRSRTTTACTTSATPTPDRCSA